MPRETTPPEDRPYVTGVFRDRTSAERAYQALLDRGYTRDDINIVMSDEARKRHFTSGKERVETELGNKALEGAGVGGALGGAIGAAAAAVAAIGTAVAVPGVGLVVAGPIAAALAGAGAGGAAGGLIGALVGAGIPEHRVKSYEPALREGGILMGVRPHTETDAEHIEREWRDASGENIFR